MRVLSKHVLAAAAAAVMAGSGLLWAQPGRAPEPAPQGQPAPAKAPAKAPDAAADVPDPDQPAEMPALKPVAELSPQEMVVDAERLIAEIRAVRAEVVTLQTDAREAKDVVRLNCIEDKLAQIDQLLLIADAARTELAAAVAAGDFEGRSHQHSLVVLSREKAQAVRQEADGCIGEEMRFPGNADIDVDDPGLDDPTKHPPFELADEPMLDEIVDDPAEPIWEEEIVIERPSYATPFI
jgi:hypothetical protein